MKISLNRVDLEKAVKDFLESKGIVGEIKCKFGRESVEVNVEEPSPKQAYKGETLDPDAPTFGDSKEQHD